MVKLWIKTKNVIFDINEKTHVITGTISSVGFVSAAINTLDEDTKDECWNFLNRRKCTVSTCSSMLTAHSEPIRGDKFDPRLGKRVVMLKLNMRAANFRKQLLKTMIKNKYYSVIDNFETSLKNEYKKF